MKSVLIVGATGLVGSAVLRLALADTSIARVVVPTRRPLGLQHGKLVNPVVDFDALPAGAEWWRVDAVVCTLGTTIKFEFGQVWDPFILTFFGLFLASDVAF